MKREIIVTEADTGRVMMHMIPGDELIPAPGVTIVYLEGKDARIWTLMRQARADHVNRAIGWKKAKETP